MTNDDRFNRKLKDEGNTKLKQKNASPASISGSADASGLRRSGRETSSMKQATTSPSNARKSERIEKRASPSTPLIKKKSEKTEKQSPSTPLIKKKSENTEKQTGESPLRRSDRGKKNFSPGSSGSKKLAEVPASSNIKSKKEKISSSSKESVVDVSEDNKDERQDLDVGGRKRKRMTARGYKALFKPQRIRIEADDDKDPEGQEKSPQANTSSNGGAAITVKKHDNVETSPCSKEPRINHGLENQQELDPCDNRGEEDLYGTSSSKWNKSSTMPHKLLKKRLLLSFKPLNESQEDAGKVLNYHYEWLVEWEGLDCGQATWESESAVLGSPKGQHLIKEYDDGHGKMGISATMVDKTKEPSIKPPTSPAGGPPGMDLIHLSYVKKLQDSWTKGQNRVLFDNQERAMRVVLFILSLDGVTHPLLIITTSGSLAQWEAMFLRVAPSNDFKISIEVRETQRSVRLLEAQKEGGQLAFQVLLYCVDAFAEDLSMLKNIKWEAVMVDESQCSEISAHFNDIKSLSTNKRLLLFGGPLGESMVEYLNVLSLLGYDGALSSNTRSKTESDDSLGKLKETLSQYVAYECKSDSSKFVEFWVPVQLSNVQLEQYCVTLFSNAMALRSSSKSDTIGALHDILISNRKCCNHPYIVDPNLQGLIMKDHELSMLLDVGIKASGKLQFLDLILPEVKKRQLRVVILFQPTVGTAKGLASVGDILDDFLHHRFGQDSYERIDGVGIVPSKKQAALNNFNKEMSRFVFLLEHRACQASIKLSSVDIIVIFDSDLNPANDLKALQKISIDSQSEQIIIFRLYSSSTLEEKILRLAEHNVAIDSKLQNLNRSSCDALLMFGASDLLNKLTQFHSASVLNIASEESFLKDVWEEFLYLISHKCSSNDTSKSIITRVQSCGIYGKNLPLHSETKTPLPFGEQPHLFWRKLLEGKYPRWKFVSVSTPRQRKRPHYFEDSSKETSAAHADVGKKRKKTLNNSIEPAASKPVIEAETGGRNEGASAVPAHNESQSSSGDHFWSTGVHNERSLHHLLKPTVSELCEVLKLSEDVKITVERFLEFVLENYNVSKEHTSTLQAFMISLCWIASSLSRYKIDRRESFALAKKHLNFSCMEEEANSVYLKLEPAKEMFLQHTESQEKCDALKDCIQAPQATGTESTEPKMSHSLPTIPQGGKQEIVDCRHNQNADVSGSHELSNEEMLQSTEKMANECKEDLATKDQTEIEMFNRGWDEKRMLLENDYKVDKALIRTLHSNPSVRSEKLKLLEKEFANKLEEHERTREIHLKDLMAKLLAVEGQITANCIPSFGEGRANHELTLYESQHENQMVHSGNSIQEAQDAPEANPTSSANLIEVQSHDKMHTEPSISLANPDGGNDRVNGVNNIESTGSHTSEKQKADATASSVPIGEIPAQQHDGIDNNVVGHVDSVESGVPEVDPNEENAKGGNSSPIASPAIEDRNETGPGDMPLLVDSAETHVDSAVKDRNETGPSDMQTHVHSAEMGAPACNKDNGEDSTIIPDTSHVVEDQNDPCGSSSSNSPSAAVSPDKTPAVELVASPVSDHSIPTIPEIQNESLQLQQLPFKDKEGQADRSSLAEIDVDNLQPIDAGQVGQINPEDPSFESHDELSLPLSTGLPIAENQSDILLPASGLLPEATREEPTLPGGPGQSAENHTNPSDHTMLQSSGNLVEHQPSSDAVHDQQSVEPYNSAQNSELPAPTVTAEIPNQNASRPEINMFDVHISDNHNQVASRMPNQVDPLQAELERLCAVKDNVIKFHEDIRQRLKSDCEKEIAEMIAQINMKYEAKRQEAEAAFHSKKKELDINLNRVVMNKILAEAFRSKCQDFTPGSAGMQQVTQAGLMQQLHRFSILPSARRSFGVTSSSPGQSLGSQQITPLPPLPPAPLPPPPLQIVHQPAALFSSTLSRPPPTSSRPLPNINPMIPSTTPSGPPPSVDPTTPSSSLSRLPPGISPITPSSTLSRLPTGMNPMSPLSTPNRPPPSINPITPSAGNLRVNSETRAPAPHLRPLVSSEIRAPAPHMRPLGSSEIRAPAPHIRPFRPSTSASADFASYRKMLPNQHVTSSLTSPSNSQATVLPPVPPEDSTVPQQRPPSAASSWLPSRSQSPQPPPRQSTPPPSLYAHQSSSLPHSNSLPRIPTSQPGLFSASPRSEPLLTPDNSSRHNVLPPPLSDMHMDIDLTDLNEFVRDFGAPLVCLSDDD